MERSIEFLLKSQANFEARLEQVTNQIGTLAQTQNDFMKVMLRHIEAQGEINVSMRDSIRVLTATVERHFNNGGNGKSST